MQIKKREGTKSLYPLPATTDDGSRLCVRVNIPNIPAHRQAFIGAIYNLTRWYSWARDEAHTAKAIAAVWRDVYMDMMAHFYDGCDDCPPEDKCRDYPTDSGVLSYFPTNPFTEPEEIPNQFYNKPPFYILSGDVLTDITVPSANPLDLPYLAETELPRIRVTVNGDKLVRLYLLSIIQGGYASITVDDNPLTVNWVDLTRASLIDFQALLNAIEEGLGIGSLNGILVEQTIVEVKLETVGEHHIDIIFWPKFNTEVIVGFGGGLRKVEICGNEMCDDMTFELRQNPENPCLIEQKTSADGDWITAFDLGACMTNNCCDDTPPIYRFTIDGILERSTDDGATYEPAPQYDPRRNSPQFPPLAGDDNATKRCLAAAGAAALIKQQVGNELTDDMGRYTLAELISDWVNTVVNDGGNILEALITLAANQTFAIGIATLRAALTDTVYDTLQCILYCNISPDASFSEAQWQAVKSDIAEQIGGIASLFLQHLVNVLGAVGLTNLARSGGATEGDCDDCECGGCSDLWVINPEGVPEGYHGTVIGRDETSITVQSGRLPDSFGLYYLWVWTGSSAACCETLDAEAIEGSWLGVDVLWRACGSNSDTAGNPAGQNMWSIFIKSSVPFTANIIFAS